MNNIISSLLKNILYSGLGLIFITAVFSIIYNKISLFRLMVTIITLAVFFSVLFWIFDISGLWENVSTVANLKKFINDKGVYSGLVFVLIQFLQVVAVPLPGVITVGAGNILFGAFWGGILSFIGIILGTVTAFLIGRKFGYKLVVWIAGEETVNKWLEKLKNRDKVMFTMIFLLPFFPDDLLCFVAGLTSMSLLFFTCMAIVTRIITITATSVFAEFLKYLLLTQSLIGYVLLLLIAISLLVIFILTLKYGEKLQTYLESKYHQIFKKKNKEE
ncbi:MAG: VTT domain-containing protein [Clostridia bacterium]|nr:VTT domain-containing protein [Clostridia bacterium]